jgi:hypothetical protein
MRDFIAFECADCKVNAITKGIAVDEDGRILLDTDCPKCNHGCIITTSVQELQRMNAPKTLSEPAVAFVM